MTGPDAEKVTPLRPRVKCPECGKPAERAHFPFCSPRCKAVDLNRWLSGAYVLPRPLDDDDMAPETPEN